MRIQDILATGAPLQLVVDAMDLKELFLNWKEEMVQKPQKEESPLLTPAEVTEKYRTGRSARRRLGQSVMRLFAGLL